MVIVMASKMRELALRVFEMTSLNPFVHFRDLISKLLDPDRTARLGGAKVCFRLAFRVINKYHISYLSHLRLILTAATQNIVSLLLKSLILRLKKNQCRIDLRLKQF